ncbi:hypothetical protein [Actinomyces massiliensis]|uniref:hypothetical protein n=1 Tax=Actinomyces massiliensis TaxID=461393 RepID=UPI0028E576FB|nr:hypothetical protein [Actinomyces massiliensis]
MTEKDFQRIQKLLTTNLNAVEERINGRLDKVDERLDKIDGRLDSLEGRMNSLEGRMNGVESRLDTLEHEMKEMLQAWKHALTPLALISMRLTLAAALDEKIDRNHQEVTKRIDTLSKDIKSQHQDALEAKGALKLLTTQHEQLAGRVAIIESRLQAA